MVFMLSPGVQESTSALLAGPGIDEINFRDAAQLDLYSRT